MQLIRLDRRIALSILARLKASSVGRIIWGMFFVNIGSGLSGARGQCQGRHPAACGAGHL